MSSPVALTAGDVFSIATGVVFFAFSVVLLPLIWRNQRGFHTDTRPPWWTSSGAAWRAVVRMYPVILLSTVLFVPGTLALLGLDGVLAAVGGVLVGLAFLLWCLTPVVVAFNRPRLLVAPHHRALPGWRAEARGAPAPPVPPPAKPPKWQRDDPASGSA